MNRLTPLLFTLLLTSAAPFASRARADARTDGTLGAARSFQGSFTVPASLGRQRGGNLFHSFANFDLAANDVATFSGPTSVKNVLIRVTGGQPSFLDGTLACDIPGANVFFINPSGIGSQQGVIDVKGSFVATTADVVRLRDGGRFDASRPAASSLTTAPPSAFGFLNTPAPILLDGAGLPVPRRRSLALIAGEIQATNMTILAAQGGSVHVVASAAKGTVKWDPSKSTSPPDASGIAAFAPITLTGNTTVLAAEGGGVTVRGGAVTLADASILAGSNTGVDSRGVALTADSLTLQGAAQINTRAIAGAGRGGTIAVDAGQITFAGTGRQNETGLFADTLAPSTGPGGNIVVRAGTMDLSNLAQISASTATAARGGAIDVRAQSIRFAAGGAILAETLAGGQAGEVRVAAGRITMDNRGNASIDAATGISSDSAPDATGAGGDVFVRARSLQLVAGGNISAGAAGKGHGGSIHIDADRLTLDDRGNDSTTFATGIFAVPSQGATGNGGTIAINAGRMSLDRGAEVTTGTLDAGNSGDVRVTARDLAVRSGSIISSGSGSEINAATVVTGNAGSVRVSVARTLTIDGRGNPIAGSETGINAPVAADSTGHGGTVTVIAGRLNVLAGGVISASTVGRGDGGDVKVRAGSLFIDDVGNPTPGTITGIAATAEGNDAPGAAGTVDVRVRTNAAIVDNGQIVTFALASRGGNLRLAAGRNILLDAGVISAQAAGDGGNVRVTAPLFITLRGDSSIDAVSKSLNGGNIAIDPFQLAVLDASTISANGGRNGGNISLSADRTPGVVTAGEGANVTATGRTGTAGAINTNPATNDVLNAIVRLPGDFLARDATLQPRCAEGGAFSSFLVSGKGGLSIDPQAWDVMVVPEPAR